MKYHLLTAAIAMPLLLTANSTEYINRAAKLSLEVTKGTSILPSVQIAQSIEESGYGKSKNAVENSNYFGLRKRKNCNAPFKYESFSSMRESFEAYVKRLKQPRYKKALEQKSSESMTRWIAKLGYCPDPNYADRVIAIIRKYNLTKYDKRELPMNFIIR